MRRHRVGLVEWEGEEAGGCQYEGLLDREKGARRLGDNIPIDDLEDSTVELSIHEFNIDRRPQARFDKPACGICTSNLPGNYRAVCQRQGDIDDLRQLRPV